MRYTNKNIKDNVKFDHAMSFCKVKCKCSHTIEIPYNVDKILCNWCNCWVFRNPKDEFKYRLEEARKKGK